MPRKPIVGGNWKCNPKTIKEALQLIQDWKNQVPVDKRKIEVFACPMMPHLLKVKQPLEKMGISACAQNCSKTGEGAFTGEVSAAQLKDSRVQWTLVGHSERRTKYGETDEDVAEKVAQALAADVKVVLAIGELLEEREGGKTNEINERMLAPVIKKVKAEDWNRIVIAYEPVWAIGTGKVATPEQAEETHAAIRAYLAKAVSEEVAEKVRIQYGGSVTVENCRLLLRDFHDFAELVQELSPMFSEVTCNTKGNPTAHGTLDLGAALPNNTLILIFPWTLATMVCGDCARDTRLAAPLAPSGAKALHQPGPGAAGVRPQLNYARRAFQFRALAIRFSVQGLLTTLFVVRAAQIGQLQRWGGLVAKLSDDPFWLSAALLGVASILLPVPRVILAAPAVVVMLFCEVELEPGLFFGAVAWLMQTLQLLSELICSVKEFLLCILHSWTLLPQRAAGRDSGGPSGLRAVEWGAALVFPLCVAAVVYHVVAMRLERWMARQRLRRGLQTALASPFRAEFDGNFGRQGHAGRHRKDSSFSLQFINSGNFSEEQLASFKQKLPILLEARRGLLAQEAEDEEMLQDHFELHVRRSHILADSWEALQEAAYLELLAPKLRIEYEGEQAQDQGGVAQDWFCGVGHALAADAGKDESSSILTMGKSSRMLIPRPVQSKEADGSAEGRYRDLFVCGRFLALATLHGGRPLPMPLSPFVCKYLVGAPVELSDMKHLDSDFYRQRVEPLLRPNGLEEVESALGEPLTFLSVPTELRPAEELEPGGASRVVNKQNLHRYLVLLCEAFLCSELREELQCLVQGFWDVLPLEALRAAHLEASDLAILLTGSCGVDVGEWRRCSEEQADAGLVISWFWEIVEEMPEELRRQLLRFATGSARLPPGGFAALKPRFAVVVSAAGSEEHLPHAHTCINQLVLHRYASKEQLRCKLSKALPTESFGFA
ncbi:Tpi [Symbiodinium natans]|uniref:triose-phosphate isomerase n=1 Tax=Symbiodinium natans TaxID=878477 RepID=A0A812UYP6_9DINO|nr:Tpi [Symbiodinium natans]